MHVRKLEEEVGSRSYNDLRLFEVRGRGKPLEDFNQGNGRAGLGFLAIMNNAVMNIHVHLCVFMCSSEYIYVFISLGNIFRSGIAGSFGNSMSPFLKHRQTFPKWLLSFYSLPSSVGGFQLLHIVANICYCLSV